MKPEAAYPLPNPADFSNERFFGSVDADRRQLHNLKSRGEGEKWRSPPLRTSRLTRDWLDEAKRMVEGGATLPPASPARVRRLAAASQAEELAPPARPLDKRDALSRSARRNRYTKGVSDEILQRSSLRHSRTISDFRFSANSSLPAHSRFLLKPHEFPPSSHSPENAPHQNAPPLSPPRNLLKPSHRRTFSSAISSVDNDSTSSPRNSVSSGRRLSVYVQREEDVERINAFLRRQKAMIGMASEGEVSIKAKIVLSSCSPDTSSMVAAICYSWLLENTRGREESCVKDEIVVPVINMRRGMMWEHMQAAWLFHHIGIDASALIFSDEVDLACLLMGKQLSLVTVGQDVLQKNEEVGSLCTILTDNYCEDAYDLLQAPNIKRLLLAGILLDTQNLSCAVKSFTNRDAEAVQLLLVGSSSNYRDFFFKQVIKEHGEESFLKSLRQHYGGLSTEVMQKPSTTPAVGRTLVQPTLALPPAPFKVTEKSSRVKNKFTLGRLFKFSA